MPIKDDFFTVQARTGLEGFWYGLGSPSSSSVEDSFNVYLVDSIQASNPSGIVQTPEIAGPAAWPADDPKFGFGNSGLVFTQIGQDPSGFVASNSIVRATREVNTGTPNISVWDWLGTGTVHNLLVPSQEFQGPCYDGTGHLWFIAWEADNRLRLYRTRTDLRKDSGDPGADLIGAASFQTVFFGITGCWLTDTHVMTADDRLNIPDFAWVWSKAGGSSIKAPFVGPLQDIQKNSIGGIPIASVGSFRINHVSRGTVTNFVGGNVEEIETWPVAQPAGVRPQASLAPDGRFLCFPFEGGGPGSKEPEVADVAGNKDPVFINFLAVPPHVNFVFPIWE